MIFPGYLPSQGFAYTRLVKTTSYGHWLGLFYSLYNFIILLYLQLLKIGKSATSGTFISLQENQTMHSSFNGKTSSTPRGADYDFLNGVFEWVFYNLPPRADNTFTRNMYEFYKTRGGLSKKQLEALLRIINGINATPPFSTATLEAIIKKKASKSKSALPPATPMYKEDTETKSKLDEILSLAPAHKAALMYITKVNQHQLLTQADKDAINKFHLLITTAKKK